MRQDHNDRGFGAIEVIVFVVLLAIIALLGWRIWTSHVENQDLRRERDEAKTRHAENPNTTTLSESAPKSDPAPRSTLSAADQASWDEIVNNTRRYNGAASRDAVARAPLSLKRFLAGEYRALKQRSCDPKAVLFVSELAADKQSVLYSKGCQGGGAYIAVSHDDEWQEVFAGQQPPTCSLVARYQIDKAVVPECFIDGSGGQLRRR